MHIYIYIYSTYTYIYIYISLSISFSLSLSIYIYIYIYIYIGAVRVRHDCRADLLWHRLRGARRLAGRLQRHADVVHPARLPREAHVDLQAMLV